MDSLTFTVMVRLLSALAGARVNKIHQPGRDELVLRLWTGGEEERLYLRVRKGDATLYLSRRRSFANPFTPPRFCQLLRARLKRLREVEQWHGDRLAVLTFDAGDGSRCRLVVDFRHTPNLVLLDERSVIIDTLFRHAASGLLPGGTFRWPEPVASNLLDGVPRVPDLEGDELRRWLLERVTPLPPWMADVMVRRVGAGEEVGELLTDLRQRLLDTRERPVLIGNSRTRLMPFRLRAGEGEVVEEYVSLHAALEAADDTPQAHGDELQRTVAQAIARLERRLLRIEADGQQLQEVDALRRRAELLVANLHRVRRGMESVAVEDYFQDPPASSSIPLDPARSPQENVERMFRRVRKLQRGGEHVARRLGETRDELAWLREMQLALDDAHDSLERDQLARDLAAAGWLKLRAEPASRSRAKPPEPLLRSLSPSGFELVWGKNPRGNDLVSCTLTQHEDLWFHAHQRPGCHLVLRRGGKSGEVPAADIEFAASLAAGYSSARDEPKVDVIVARGRAVRKPKGARPGLVTVERYETVRVSPMRLPKVHDIG